MIFWDAAGAERTGRAWAPGPADRSVWLLPDDDPAVPVLVALVNDGPAVELPEYRDRGMQRGMLTAQQRAEGRRLPLSTEDWQRALAPDPDPDPTVPLF